MRLLMTLATAALLAVAATPSYATTWAPSQATDPVSKARISVSEPMSSGSYIYQWPEKSDQVFWPHTDSNWLWFNPKSGYIAFGGDFEQLTPAQVASLAVWLKANFDRKTPLKSRLARLGWAEKVYAARGMDDAFWAHFYRLMAFETRESPDVRLGYVRKALPLIEARLAKATEAGQRLESLYLLSEYNRRLGKDAQASAYLAQLNASEAKDDLSSFKEYLLSIAAEQRNPPAAQQSPK